jgi:hypothetical protein
MKPFGTLILFEMTKEYLPHNKIKMKEGPIFINFSMGNCCKINPFSLETLVNIGQTLLFGKVLKYV